MGNFIEINMIKAYGPNCLNRGEDGQIKTVYNGGDLRTRISSQSIKRAIRDNMSDASIHTRYIVSILMNRYVAENPDATEEDKEKMATVFGTITESKKLDKKERNDKNWGYESAQITAYAQSELIALYDWICKDEEIIQALSKGTLSNEIKNLRDAVVNLAGLDLETSIFGRMTTAGPGRTVFSATHFNHPYSIDINHEEYDYFSAIDTYLRSLGKTESGYLDNASFAANAMYGYMNIDPLQMYNSQVDRIRNASWQDVRKLKEKNIQMVKDGVAEIIRLYLNVNPSGKQNSMATAPPASIACVSFVKDGFVCTMDGCFNKAINKYGEQGITDIAADRIIDYMVKDRPKQNYIVDTIMFDSATAADVKKLKDIPNNVDVSYISNFETVIAKVVKETEAILRDYIGD